QEKHLGAQSIEVARTLHNIAVVQVRAKCFDDAERSYRKAIPIFQKTETHEDALLSQWLSEYAAVLRHQKRFGEAEQAEVQAVRIQVRTAIGAKPNDAAPSAFVSASPST